MKIKEIGFCNTLFYLLGVLATIQILSIGGITVFNILLVTTAILPLLIYIKRLKIDVFFVISFIASLITLFTSICNEALTTDFRTSAIINGTIYIGVLFIYLFMNNNVKSAYSLIQGFKYSCKLTLFWCLLQVLLFYTFHIDLNQKFFGDFLKISGANGAYYNGSLIPTGFYTHRAILLPSLIFLLFATNNIYVILLTLFVGFLTKSTALIIGLLLTVIYKLLIWGVENYNRRINRKSVILFLMIFVIFIFICLMYHSEINEHFEYIITRIIESTSNKADNSSVVHFLYYKNLYPILQKLDLHNLLFGTGFGTSGIHYTWYNGQYSFLATWVVESDYVNIVLNQGVIGFLIWYYVLAKIVLISKRYKLWDNIGFVLIITFVGIMYNIQFTWFIIVELGMFVLTKNKIYVFKKNR